MTFAVAAAGTGGHVYPGLAVGEALVAAGVPPEEVLFVGGRRLESTVYPQAGFPFLEVEMRGLQRRLTPENLSLPLVVARAVRRMAAEFSARRVRVLLGMGGYVTVPAALAARRVGAAVAVSEQNAEAGLANRIAGRLAMRRFGAFSTTAGLAGAEWVGNPVRAQIARFDRPALRPEAIVRYGLDPETAVVGVFGGSLGAGALNRAVADHLARPLPTPHQVLHLAGRSHADALREQAVGAAVSWHVLDFEERMDLFYAACDLVVARAGGAVAELSVTATPAVLVPGTFGSGRHQAANAAALEAAGSAVVVEEGALAGLGEVVAALLADGGRRAAMAAAARRLARPEAAAVIAAALGELHG